MEASSASRQFEITLLQERNAGTFARVYLAEATSPGGLSRIVAVKILKEQWNESVEILDRMRDEARLLARLHHRSILRVESLAQIDGQPAIIMEFVDGLDLRKMIETLAAQGQRMPPRTAYKIAQDAAGALEAAYFKIPLGMDGPLKVVHRDIKPSNIMVSVEGEVKVLDFGTARYTSDSRIARTGAMRFGSLKYMSPERRQGDRGDHSSDVYALGLVLIELLRGEVLPLLPLDAREHDETIADIIGRLSNLGLPNSDWDDSLRQTLAGMCASAPSGRLSAAQVVQLLRAFAEQASGSSLDSFAADLLEPLTRAAHGESGAHGALSGTRIFAAMSDSSGTRSAAGAQPAAQAAAPAQTPAAAATPAGHVADPAASRGLVVAADAPANVQPVQSQPVHAQTAQSQPVHAQPARPEPSRPQPVAARPQDRVPVQAAPQYFEEEDEDGGGGKMVMVAVALAGVLAVLALALVVALGAAWYMLRTPAPETIATPEPAAEPAAVAAADSATQVRIRSTDETVQWIRLTDANDVRVLSASPDASAALAPGDYVISAKMVGRPKATAALTVGEDALDLSCAPSPKNTVTCTRDGAEPLVLAP